jgi:ubiquinone/menaquinone biosynthesis C-methylase UbiE
MTAHVQAMELLAPLAKPGETVLDVGCGAGYFFHSVARSNLGLEYYGIDASASLIAIGKEELPRFGLQADRLLFSDDVFDLAILDRPEGLGSDLAFGAALACSF